VKRCGEVRVFEECIERGDVWRFGEGLVGIGRWNVDERFLLEVWLAGGVERERD